MCSILGKALTVAHQDFTPCLPSVGYVLCILPLTCLLKCCLMSYRYEEGADLDDHFVKLHEAWESSGLKANNALQTEAIRGIDTVSLAASA